MKLQCRKAIAAGLAIALCVSGMAAPKMASAAKVTKVKLNKNKITLYAGAEKAKSSVTLKATVKPAKAAKVTWSTSAKKIATVSKKGMVNAKKAEDFGDNGAEAADNPEATPVAKHSKGERAKNKEFLAMMFGSPVESDSPEKEDSGGNDMGSDGAKEDNSTKSKQKKEPETQYSE